MNILNKLTLKHLSMNKRRTIVSIIGILLSTALMVGIGLLCSSFREFMITEEIRYTGSYHAKIENAALDKFDILDSNKNIEQYYYNYKIGTSEILNVDDEYLKYFYIYAGNDNFLKGLSLIRGEYPKNDNEVVLAGYYASSLNYRIGDKITLEYGKRMLDGKEVGAADEYLEDEVIEVEGTKEYTITGFIEPKYYFSYFNYGVGLLTKDMTEDNKEVDLYLTYKNPKKAYSLTETIYKNLGLVTTKNAYIEYNTGLLMLYGVSTYDNINVFVIKLLSIILGIISIACFVVIYNSFAISVMERKKQFGLFSSIGATKGQLRKTVFFEALVTGSIGLVLGIASAYLGIGLLILVINNLLGDVMGSTLGLTTYPIFIVIPVIFVIGTVIISAFLPARSASKISPIEVIRQNDDIKIKRTKIKSPKILPRIFGIEGDIAYKNIKRNQKKYRITIVSLFISIVAFMVFSAFLHYGITSASLYVEDVDYDVILSYEEGTADKEDLNILNEITSNSQVKKWSKVLHLNTPRIADDNSLYTKEYMKSYINSYGNDDYSKNFRFLNIFVLSDEEFNQYKKKIGLKEDRPIFPNKFYEMTYIYEEGSNGRESSRKIVETSVYKPNDNIDFTVCSRNRINDKFYDKNSLPNTEIAELKKEHCNYKFENVYLTDKTPDMFSNLSTGHELVISDKMYQDYIRNNIWYEEDKMVFVNTYMIVDKYDEISKLSKDLVNINYTNYKEELEQQKNFILVSKIMFYGFISLVTLIGVTSVFNTINTSINLRKREFAMLRSVGLTPHGFNKIIWYESLFFGVKSLLYSIPVGMGLSFLIHNTFYDIVETEYSILWSPIIVAVIGVFAIVLITMWYSTVKLKKENVLEAIRMENI